MLCFVKHKVGQRYVLNNLKALVDDRSSILLITGTLWHLCQRLDQLLVDIDQILEKERIF